MKQKMTIPVLAVVLCAGTVQADGNFLSLPKVNDSAFGYCIDSLEVRKKPGGHWIIRDLMGLDLVGLASL